MDTNRILVILLVVYLVLYVAELIGLYRFNLWFYRHGFRICTKEINIKFSNWNCVDEEDDEEAYYVFLSDFKTGYFVTKYRLFRSHNLFAQSSGLPLIIFGKFEEIENKLVISYQISYRVIFLIALWFSAWIILPIWSAFHGNWINLAIGGGGIFFTGLVLYFAYMFQEIKMIVVQDKILEVLRIRKRNDSN